MSNAINLSIIIPCYNCADTLRDAVNSCYTQGFAEQEFEIVMVDDGSTDSTYQLMKTLAREKSNIKLVRHEVNKGGGATRNTAVRSSKGEVVFCLDSDDMLKENTLFYMYNKLKSSSLDGVCLGELISFKGNDTNDISHRTLFSNKRTYVLEDLLEREYPCGLNSVFMFTKDAFEECGGYPVSHGFDTQGFAWRFLAHNLKAESCQDAAYYHRVQFHQSYYLREYISGMTNINMQSVVLEHAYLLTEEAKNIVTNANVADFTQPLITSLKSLPKVFREDAYELVRHIPSHEHDQPVSCRPIKVNSLRGIYFRLRTKLRNQSNRKPK